MFEFQKKAVFKFAILATAIFMTSISCGHENVSQFDKGSFGYDLQFLEKFGNPIVLNNFDSTCNIIVSPEYQGRVMTSTAKGMEGMSYGWVNHKLIASGEILEQFNPIGGEDRFWMGPEGGQYGLFFKKGEPFDWTHWQPPREFDKDTFRVVKVNTSSVTFEEDFTLDNYSETTFSVNLIRTISLLTRKGIAEALSVSLDKSLYSVGFKSVNTIKNTGRFPWTDYTGKVSIWILGVFIPSDDNKIIVPLRDATGKDLDEVVNTRYYWNVPESRMNKKENHVYFKADGKFQCKIGIGTEHAMAVTGSYDPLNNLLTVVRYTLPENEKAYVNSLLKYQEDPYKGDVLNFYNDGVPLEGGEQYGPFYEIETSSPALGLAPDSTYTHVHETYHFQGNPKMLNGLSMRLLGVDLSDIPQF